jgi:hypothetical protein
MKREHTDEHTSFDKGWQSSEQCKDYPKIVGIPRVDDEQQQCHTAGTVAYGGWKKTNSFFE